MTYSRTDPRPGRALHARVGMPPFHLWPGIPRCVDADPDAFFVEKGGDANPAKAICAVCPVQAECLAWALATPGADDDGIWGGTSPRERVELRRRMGRAGVRSRWAA